MNKPFFSVIIPVYNRAEALVTAIASVQAQSCQDFEIVVVDDGSRDDPAAAVAAINDPRIRFFRQENAGGGAARNRAIDEARGRFVAPLDSDDIFLPHHLADMKALLEHTQNTVGYARILVDRGGGRIIVKPPRGLREGEHMAEYLLCDRGFVPTITIAVETETARRVRYSGVRPAEDTDLAVRLFLDGCHFKMLEKPSAVWNDIRDPKRTSASRGADRFGTWLDEMKPHIPARAWHGGRGWAYAKLVSRSDRAAAFKLYLTALRHRCYAPRLAVVIFLQIFLGDARYRHLADAAIRWLRMGLRDAEANQAASPAGETLSRA